MSSVSLRTTRVLHIAVAVEALISELSFNTLARGDLPSISASNFLGRSILRGRALRTLQKTWLEATADEKLVSLLYVFQTPCLWQPSLGTLIAPDELGIVAEVIFV